MRRAHRRRRAILVAGGSTVSLGKFAMTQVPLPAEHGIAEKCSDRHSPCNGHAHPVIPVLHLLPLAVLALMAGLGAVSWIAHIGEVCATGFLRPEQSVVYSPRSGRV